MKTKGDKKKCGKPNHLNHSHLQTLKCSEFQLGFFLSLKIISEISNKAIYKHSVSVTQSCSLECLNECFLYV